MKKENKEEKKDERYVLDSFALLAHFEKTKGWEKVLELLEKASLEEVKLYSSLINLGEIYYIFKRERSLEQAEEMVLDTDQLPIEKKEASWQRIKEAASIKADYPVSYADAFAIALAKELNCSIITGDPEFEKVENIVSVLWL